MKMSSIKSLLPVRVLVDTGGSGTNGRMIFSPGKAKTAVVLYEDAPPEIHDFGKAELLGNRMQGHMCVLDETTKVTRRGGQPLGFRDPAGCAAYRPGKDELAIVFRTPGEEAHDSNVWRLNPSTGQSLPSIYFDNPSALAYSSDGELMAVGGASGMVTVFRLEPNGDAVELRTVPVAGGVRNLVFEELNHQLYVANENNMLVSFYYYVEDDVPVRRGVDVEGEDRIDNMCLKALAYSSGSNLLATAGIGKEVWVSNPLKEQGRMIKLRKATRINALQFDEKSDTLVVLADSGVELVKFALDSEHLPVFEQRTTTFSSIINLVGCHHYGDFLFIGSLLSEPLG